MKVTLLSPPGDLDALMGRMKGIRVTMAPLGLLYVAAALEREGFLVDVADAFAEDLREEEIYRRVERFGADVVGLAAVTPSMPAVERLVRGLKARRPEKPVILGGVHPTILPEETLETSGADAVVRGEGEFSTPELCRALASGGRLEKIAGVSFRRKNKIRHNPDRPVYKNVDALPCPAWHLYPVDKITAPPHWDLARPAFPITASRGCPYRCTYCAMKASVRGAARQRSVGEVVGEARGLVERYGARELMFFDACFSLRREWTLEFCRAFTEAGLARRLVWYCQTEVTRVDDEILREMHRAGCRVVAYGIESATPEILKRVKKPITPDAAREAVRLAKKHGIETIGYFMLGLPGETVESARRTIAFAKELDVDYAKFNLFVPYPGTGAFEEARAEGLIRSGNLDRYVEFSGLTTGEPIYVPAGMKAKELLDLQREAVRSYYFRPRIIGRFLARSAKPRRLLTYARTGLALARTLF